MISKEIRKGDCCERTGYSPCCGPKNCIWIHCYYVKKYKEKLGMLYYTHSLQAGYTMILVLCHCGFPPVVDETGEQKNYTWKAKCSNPYCGKDVAAKTEKEVCKKWNIKYDWYVHELGSVFSEEEYIKMVEDCGGHIEPTPHWEEHKQKPCKHCEQRERIKESIIKEIEKETNAK